MPFSPGAAIYQMTNPDSLPKRFFDQIILKRPKLVLICLLLLVSFLGYMAKDFRLDASAETLVLENDGSPNLRQRVTEKIRASDLLVCGANGMGYYNFQDGIWACGFDTRGNHVRVHRRHGADGVVRCATGRPDLGVPAPRTGHPGRGPGRACLL